MEEHETAALSLLLNANTKRIRAAFLSIYSTAQTLRLKCELLFLQFGLPVATMAYFYQMYPLKLHIIQAVSLSKCLSKTHILGGTRPQQLEGRSEQIKGEKNSKGRKRKKIITNPAGECNAPKSISCTPAAKIRAPENV